MKAKFEVRSICSQWKPPFKKDITEDVFSVDDGEEFDRIVGNGNNEAVFTLISVSGDSAKLKYSKLFTLKEGNPTNREFVIGKDETIALTYLWGEDGITKKITFRGNVITDSNSGTNTESNNSSENKIEE